MILHQHLLCPFLTVILAASSTETLASRSLLSARKHQVSSRGSVGVPCSGFYHECVDAEAALCARYGYDPVFKGHSGCVSLIRNHVALCEKERQEKAQAEKDSLQSKIDRAYEDIERDLQNKNFVAWRQSFQQELENTGFDPHEGVKGAQRAWLRQRELMFVSGEKNRTHAGEGGHTALEDLERFEGYCEECRRGDPSDPFDDRAPGWQLICKCKSEFSYVALTHEQAHALGCGK